MNKCDAFEMDAINQLAKNTNMFTNRDQKAQKVRDRWQLGGWPAAMLLSALSASSWGAEAWVWRVVMGVGKGCAGVRCIDEALHTRGYALQCCPASAGWSPTWFMAYGPCHIGATLKGPWFVAM